MMMVNSPKVSGAHKTVLLHEVLQAVIVLTVVTASTLLSVIKPQVISSDLLSFVYGGALSYAGGRAAASRASLTRRSDPDKLSRSDASG